MKNTVQIPAWLATLIVAAAFSLQGWMLKEISALKVNVAGLSARMDMAGTQPNHIAQLK
jgi:hypothetical protein